MKWYKEIEKHRTGETHEVQGIFPNGDTTPMLLDEFEWDLADLINEFIEIKTISWWRKRKHPNYNHLVKIYMDIFRDFKITIKHGL